VAETETYSERPGRLVIAKASTWVKLHHPRKAKERVLLWEGEGEDRGGWEMGKESPLKWEER
jgi:hypothetical protein